MRAHIVVLALAACAVTSRAIDVDDTDAPAGIELVLAVEGAVEFWRFRGHDLEIVDAGGDVVVLFGAHPTAAACARDGRILLDVSRAWYDGDREECSPPLRWLDVGTALRHELGHVVGRGHSSDPDDVMFPYFGACREVR